MMCQKCGQKEATVHLTRIVNGEKTELYLCEDCAEEMGHISITSGDPFSFNNLLAGILKPEIGGTSLTTGKEKYSCDRCGMTYEEFSKKGVFGCPDCYDKFADRLEPLIKRIHGSSRHVGKIPERQAGDLKIRKNIAQLRDKMQEAVEKEEFEKAAELRDEIHSLENKLGSD